jgi:hypothetical protein
VFDRQIGQVLERSEPLPSQLGHPLLQVVDHGRGSGNSTIDPGFPSADRL